MTRLELVWPNKDRFLLVPKDEEGKPVWVDRDHPAASEVRVSDLTATVGDVDGHDPYSDNLLFRGDSLDVLRILAEVPEYRRAYRGKVKQVYIDPPFNTGQAFTQYDDWLEHATWLSFMRERLLLVRDLLAPAGSVWVHLDDVEQHRMRVLLDEVFGPAAFEGHVVWQKADSPRGDAKGFSVDQDHILVYARDAGRWVPNRLERTAEHDAIYKSPDGDETPWFDDNPTAPGAKTHQGMVYAIQSPFTGRLLYPSKGRCWFAEQSRILSALSEWAPYEARDIDDGTERAAVCGVPVEQVRPGVKALMLTLSVDESRSRARKRMEQGQWPEVIFRSGGESGIGRKRYKPTTGIPPRTLWLHADVGHNRAAKAEVKALFPGGVPFATPKPERLLERVLHIGSDPGDIVLDCFAGSGTTAAVAHKMGRRWVTAEVVPETAEMFTRRRLELVIKGEDLGGITRSVGWQGGGGFRCVEVGPSMYVDVPGIGVLLSDDATNGLFAKAVAGQLGYEFQPGAKPLCGVRGRMRLAVLDGTVGEEEVRTIVAALAEDERVEVVGRAVLDGAEAFLASLRKGSRFTKAPRDLLSKSALRTRRRAQREVAE